MADTRWNPRHYLAFGDERTRPVADLLSRVRLRSPATVADLGCGPGNSTADLGAVYPDAAICAVDSSAEMIAAAQASIDDPQVRFEHADLTTWAQSARHDPPDLVFANAVLHWVPEHRSFLPTLLEATGQVLAFQVPGNERSPTHQAVAEIAAEPPFAALVPSVEPYGVADPADYVTDLAGGGWTVDAWETTYIHVLSGQDAVFEWIAATGARPVLGALDGDLRDRFTRRLKDALREAYPPTEHGTLLPFRRVFVVVSRT